MKFYVTLAASLAVMACSPAAEPEAEPAAEQAVEEVAVVPGGVAAGDYTVQSGEDSSPFSIDADGNWTSVDEEGNPTSGTSEVVDGKICFTDTGEDEAECWLNEAPAEDGSFSSTSDAGETVTVTPA